jgi:hypothetical protein
MRSMVEGPRRPLPARESADTFLAAEEADKGMAEMSKLYNENGSPTLHRR